MARPRKDDIEKRTIQVNIRLTKDEAEKVKEFATGSGLSSANWIREKVFTGRFPNPKLSPLDAAFYQELKKLDVNLNQAVHKLNVGEKLDGLFLKLIFELKALLNRIHKLLLHDGQPDQG
jgi:mobilization protein NikA